MKKLLILLQVVTVITPAVSLAVACNIGITSTREFLESLPDYDWATDADALVNYNFKEQEIEMQNPVQSTLEIPKVNNGPVDNIFDYDVLQTGYKTQNALRKQGTTGSPIVKTYRPNGNTWSDFGVDSKSRQYETFNSVLEWDQNDADLKYNVAEANIRSRNFVADTSTKNQLKNVYYRRYHDKSNTNSSIVGTNIPFSAMMTNYAYVNEFVGWGGFSNLGWMTPVSADITESLHKNGVQAIGLLYLSGWEDVSQGKLKKLFELDEQGNFKIVDILIEQALRLNFDGWYINNEANASAPDGSVVRESDIYEIIRQFNIKADYIEKTTGKHLSFTYYKNTATINMVQDGYSLTNDVINGTTVGFGASAENRTRFQLDFNRQFPGIETDYFNKSPIISDTWKSRFSSMYYEGANEYGLGNVDLRKYFYNHKNTFNDGKTQLDYDYENPTPISFGSFGNGIQTGYAKEAFRQLNAKSTTPSQTHWAWLKAQEVSNLYNTYLYTGFNGYLRNDAVGYEKAWNPTTPTTELEYSDMLWAMQRDASYSTSGLSVVLDQDPRIKNEAFSDYKPTDQKEPWLSFDENSGTYKYSYGYGNIFAEQTVLTDTHHNQYTGEEETVEKPNLTTSFSTGSGMFFVDRDSLGKTNSVAKNFPWTNNRLTDVLPTYQWDFWKDQAGTNTTQEETVDGTKHRSKITSNGQLNGYFDYNNPYKKGNSIAIGNGYDLDDAQGRIIPGQWDKNSDYNWNLWGTNLQTNDYTVDFVVRASEDDNIDSKSFDEIAKQTKITIKTTNLEDQAPRVYQPKSEDVQELENGWYKISLNLNEVNGVSDVNRISKIGLQINTLNEDKFIYNVGEFSLKDNDITPTITESKITSLTNEFSVVRNDQASIRLNWEVSNTENVDYYEVFYEYENKWYLLGNTTQTAYYVRDLVADKQIKLGLRVKYKNGDSSQLQVGTFNLSNS